jgi:hypothetical protein
VAIYIWLIFHDVSLMCTQFGCTSLSITHFDYLIGVGALELIFEIGGIVKVFTAKKSSPPRLMEPRKRKGK